MTSQETLYHAADLKLKIAALENELDMLKPSIIQAIVDLSTPEKLAVQVGELGNYSLVGYKKWEYSKVCKVREYDLKQLQKEEEANGEAKFVETFNPKFIPKKNDL